MLITGNFTINPARRSIGVKGGPDDRPYLRIDGADFSRSLCASVTDVPVELEDLVTELGVESVLRPGKHDGTYMLFYSASHPRMRLHRPSCMGLLEVITMAHHGFSVILHIDSKARIVFRNRSFVERLDIKDGVIQPRVYEEAV